MKKVGYINSSKHRNVPVYEDPNCPPGQLYFINDKFLEFARIDNRSRFQRIKDWFKHKLLYIIRKLIKKGSF